MDVCAIAANSDVLALLAKLHGRKAFPSYTPTLLIGT